MGKKKLSTVEVKERKIDGDTTTLSINITIPTKLFHISEALEEVGRIESIEKNFESSIENYYEKVYQVIAPEKTNEKTNEKPKKQTGRPKKANQPPEEK